MILPCFNHLARGEFTTPTEGGWLEVSKFTFRSDGNFSAGSMRSFNRDLFLLANTPLAVACAAFIMNCNCYRCSTHAYTNLRPNILVMLKRTLRHRFSLSLVRYWTCRS